MTTVNAPEAGDDATRFPLFALADTQAPTATQQPTTTEPETEPVPERFAPLVAKYLAKAERGEDARYWTPERLRVLISNVERWAAELDYEHLRALRFREQNPFSREVFTLLTGIALPKKQADSLAVIDRFVGEAVIAEYHAAKKRAADERDLKYIAERLAYRRVRFEKNTISVKEFLDIIIGRGHTKLGEVKRGAAPEYRLANAAGVAYVLRRRDERDYVRMKLAQLESAARESGGGTSLPEGSGEKAL